jgi:tetratricopeptide (TPR) repeat protein
VVRVGWPPQPGLGIRGCGNHARPNRSGRRKPRGSDQYWRRAEVLFSRAVGLTNEVRNDAAKARAYLGWGTLRFRLGDFQSARKFYNRAGNLLRSRGVKSMAGEVFHDVMLMSIESGFFDDAIKYAQRAFRWYPVHHERIPRAVHDFALLLVWQSHFAAAVPLLERAAKHIEPPNDRALIWSSLARAAGGAGAGARFNELRSGVLDLLRNHDRYAPAALINLAFGAYALGNAAEAETLAREGLERAELRPTFKVEERVAIELLAALAAGIPPQPDKRIPSPTSSPEAQSLSEVITRAAEMIEGWHGPTWRRKRQAGAEAKGRI